MSLKEKTYPIVEKSLMLGVALLTLTLVALGIFGNNGFLTYNQLNRHYRDMEKRVERLKQENQRLTDETNALRNDPQMIEGVARKELGMVKPDEVLFQVRTGGKK